MSTPGIPASTLPAEALADAVLAIKNRAPGVDDLVRITVGGFSALLQEPVAALVAQNVLNATVAAQASATAAAGSAQTASTQATVATAAAEASGVAAFLDTKGDSSIWNYTGATYATKTVSVAAQDITPQDLAFSADGTKMYMVGSTGDTVYQYNLAVPWDVSTATYASKSKSVAAQDTAPLGCCFSSNGARLFIAGSINDRIYSYTLTTPWDISTAAYDGVSLDISAKDTTITGLWLKPDGLALYFVGSANKIVYQYTLGTAFDLATAVDASKSVAVTTQDISPQGLAFTTDGRKMTMIGSNSDRVYVYNLSTAFDVSTAVFDNFVSVSAQEGTPVGVFLKPGGEAFYIVGSGNDAVFQYTVPTNLAASAIVEVLSDEDRAGRRTRYRVQSSALVFKLYMDDRDLTGTYGDGKTNDAAALSTLSASYNLAGRAIVFRSGRTYRISTNLTIAAACEFERGAMLRIDDGVTVTLNGPITAGPYRIFDTQTSGVVAGSFGGAPVRPFWWGVSTTQASSAANDTLFDAAVTAALNASVVLEMDDIRIARYSFKEYTAGGYYRWNNANIVKADATGGTECFRFYGPAFGTPIQLTADAALGGIAAAAAVALAIASGERYYICDARINTPGYSSGPNKGEYVTIKSYNSGTGAIVLKSNLQSSYAIANGAALAKVNNAGMKIAFKNFRGAGGGAGLAQTFLRFLRCDIGDGSFNISDAEMKATVFECCSWSGTISINGERINQDGYGYVGDFGGCDRPRVSTMTGIDCRHVNTGSRSAASQFAVTMPGAITGATKANPCVITHAGHGLSTGNIVSCVGVVGMTQLNSGYYTVTKIDANSYSLNVNSTAWGTYTSGGTELCYIYPRTIGAQIGVIQCINGISSPFDTHPGMDEVSVGSVMGTMVVGDTQPTITIQSHDVSIGTINIEGYDQAGLLIQYYGRPSDEEWAAYDIGSCDMNVGGDGGDYAVAIENYDTAKGGIVANIDLLTGISPSGIYMTSAAGCGSILAHVDVCRMKNTAGHSAYLYNPTTDNELYLDIGLAQIENVSSNTNHYTLYADGYAFFGANAAQGAFINVGAGRIKRTLAASYLNRARGGNINLGADVKASFTTNFKFTESGNVYRTSRAAATA